MRLICDHKGRGHVWGWLGTSLCTLVHRTLCTVKCAVTGVGRCRDDGEDDVTA